MSTNNQNENSNNENNGEDERRAARLTAHALGQTDTAERAALEAELAANPLDMKTVREERAFATDLRRAVEHDAAPERSPELREAVERRLKELEAAAAVVPPAIANRKPPRSRRVLVVAIAATLMVAAVPTYFYSRVQGQASAGSQDCLIRAARRVAGVRLRPVRGRRRAVRSPRQARQGGGRRSNERLARGAAHNKARKRQGVGGTRGTGHERPDPRRRGRV